MFIIRILTNVFAYLFAFIGTVGIFIPIIPGIPLLIIAIWLFKKAHNPLYYKISNNSYFKRYILPMERHIHNYYENLVKSKNTHSVSKNYKVDIAVNQDEQKEKKLLQNNDTLCK